MENVNCSFIKESILRGNIKKFSAMFFCKQYRNIKGTSSIERKNGGYETPSVIGKLFFDDTSIYERLPLIFLPLLKALVALFSFPIILLTRIDLISRVWDIVKNQRCHLTNNCTFNKINTPVTRPHLGRKRNLPSPRVGLTSWSNNNLLIFIVNKHIITKGILMLVTRR